MIIGSIKEQNADETRVALVPSVVKKLTAGGFTVLLENGFGQKAGFTVYHGHQLPKVLIFSVPRTPSADTLPPYTLWHIPRVSPRSL